MIKGQMSSQLRHNRFRPGSPDVEPGETRTPDWDPSSWRRRLGGERKDRERAQQPEWPDKQALVSVEAELERLPPLVFAGEVDRLQKQLAEAALGRAFVLQASDCAEPFNSSFAGSPADSIRD